MHREVLIVKYFIFIALKGSGGYDIRKIKAQSDRYPI